MFEIYGETLGYSMSRSVKSYGNRVYRRRFIYSVAFLSERRAWFMCLVAPVNIIMVAVLLMSPLLCGCFHHFIWLIFLQNIFPSATTGSTSDDRYRTNRMGSTHPSPEVSDRGRPRDATRSTPCLGHIQKVRAVHRSAAIACSLCVTCVKGNSLTPYSFFRVEGGL